MGQQLTPHQIAADTMKRMFGGVNVEVNASNPTYQLDINSGGVGADDGSDFIEVGSPITVDITVVGAANGLDTGAEAPSTWYFVWLIKDPAAGTVAGLLSLSTSAPTMPGTYTKKRLIGAVYNKSDGNFQGFDQIGTNVQLDSEVVLVSAITTNWATVNLATLGAAPAGICRRFEARLYCQSIATGTPYQVLTLPGTHAGAGSGGVRRCSLGNTSAGDNYTIFWNQSVDASGDFSHYNNGISIASVGITLYGFELFL